MGSESLESSTTPDFLGEAFGEVRSYLRTAWRLLRHPILSTRAWAGGTGELMNPLSFFATGIGLQLAITALTDHFFPAPATDPQSTLQWIRETLAGQLPLLVVSIFAWQVHTLLKKRGSTLDFRGTLGAVFLGEGLDALTHALLAAGGLVASLTLHRRVTLADAPLGVTEFWFVSSAIVGAHRLPRIRTVVGPVIRASVTTAVFCALVVAAAQYVTDGKVSKFETAKITVDMQESKK